MTVVPFERPTVPAEHPTTPPQAAAPAPMPGLGVRALDIRTMNLQQITYVCDILAKAGEAVPRAYRGKPEAIFAAVMYGASLGLQPMAALQGIVIVEGAPTVSATLLGALIIQAGHALHSEYDGRQATTTITRADTGRSTSVTWTLDRAAQANLCQIKDNKPWARSQNGKPLPWELYPAAMLRSRSVAECGRAAAPEVLFGYGIQYTTEELGIVVTEDGTVPGGEVERATLAAGPSVAAGPSRDWLSLAREAETADDAARAWKAARGEGAPPAYLERIAAIGRRLRAREITTGNHTPALAAGTVA